MCDWPRTLSLAFVYPHHYAGVRDERSLDQRRQSNFPMAPGKELLICLGTFWDRLHANLKKALVSVYQWQALLHTVRPKDRMVQEARPHRQASKLLPSGVTQCHTACSGRLRIKR